MGNRAAGTHRHLISGEEYQWTAFYSVDREAGEIEYKAAVHRRGMLPKEIHRKVFFNPKLQQPEDVLVEHVQQQIDAADLGTP